MTATWVDGTPYVTGGVRRTNAAPSLLTPSATKSVGIERLATYWEGLTSFTYPLNAAVKLGNRLSFCDPTITGPNQRVMNIRVNGVLYVQNYDLYVAANGQPGRETWLEIIENDPGAGVTVSFEAVHGLTLLTAAQGFDPGATAVSTPITVTPPVDVPGTVKIVDDTDGSIAYGGGAVWQTSTDAGDAGGSDHYTSSPIATATLAFTLTQAGTIEYWAKKAAHHGIMSVKVDNQTAVDVDLYNATDALKQRVWVSPMLAAGDHVIVLSSTNRKNASSAGVVVQLDQFVINNGNVTTLPGGGGGGGTGVPAGFLTRSGSTFMLDGVATKFCGMNWDVIQGCWTGEKEAAQASSNAAVHRYFSQSPHRSVTRIWCMPGSDLAWMDTIVGIAETYGRMVSLTLFNGNADCSSISPPSYTPGTNPDELAWIAQVCSRPALKNSKCLAWWEIINEPSGTSAAKGFLDEMAAAIKAQDPNHMIATGAIAQYAYPSQAAYQDAHAGPNIDIVTWSSYSGDFTDWGPQAVAVGTALNKPAICREKGTCCGGANAGSYAGNAVVWRGWYNQFLGTSGVGCLQMWDFKLVHADVNTLSFDNALWDMWTAYDHPSLAA